MKRLRMATKLALAIIPIGLVALAAGALVARDALDRAESEERASLAAAVAADAMDSLVAFSAEHALALDIAVGGAEGGLETRQAATDTALTRLSDSVNELTPRASGSASGIVAGIAGDSSRIRSLVERLRESDPATPESAETVTDIGERLISVVTQSTFYLGDEARAREGEGAVALARASFASLQEELLIVQNEVGQSLDEETFAQQMLVLESTVEDWINTAASSSPTVEALGFTRTQTLSQDQGFTSETFPVDRNAILADAASEILVRVSNSAEAEASRARTQAGTVGVIVISALVLAAITALIVGRSTTKRVRSITAAAHHVAEVDLPKMVDSLSNPSGILEVSAPVDVDKTGRDEVGDLARSFSVLHTTLVDVANQQMETLRRGVSDIFVTLARRNRSLVDRQLALVDELEAREEDPEVLDGYYKLDHLATRMRRNAESLLVLAGAESPRMWSQPVEMGEVIRAALGEVDEYQRIEVLAMEPSMLTGKAVSDLSHLVSELLDNATQFSSPTERVRVTGLFDDDGYVITIADSGVGMSTERMAGLNHLMENPPVLGLALEPTLGTYVVARLAMRHGIKVKLVPGVPGTTVRVTIPRDLLETGKVDVPAEPDEAPAATSSAPPIEVTGPTAVPAGHSANGQAATPAAVTEDLADIAAADDEAEPDVSERFEAVGTDGPTADRPAGDGPAETDGLRRRPTPTFSPRIDDVMRTAPAADPTATGSPRHAASASEPASTGPETSKVEDRVPDNGRTLPTRQPGTSFHETNELAATSASSQSSPTGIRNALDGFRQGREIATQRDKSTDADDAGNDEESST
jgi:signal transduction histidine kinase